VGALVLRLAAVLLGRAASAGSGEVGLILVGAAGDSLVA
jgi:hypothetical protein